MTNEHVSLEWRDRMPNCKRCSAITLDGSVKLVGGNIVTLCQDCRNDFHDYANSLDEFSVLINVEAEYGFLEMSAQAGAQPSKEEVLTLNERARNCRRTLFAITKEWIAKGKGN